MIFKWQSLLERAVVVLLVYGFLVIVGLSVLSRRLELVAVLDCGSATTKLSLFRFLCRSGECELNALQYLAVPNSLSDAGTAMYSTLSTFRNFLANRVDAAASKVQGAVAGTQAFRLPASKTALLQEASIFLFGGGKTAILSGEEEAYLTFKSVELLLHARTRGLKGPFLVADLGGGSLELAWLLGSRGVFEMEGRQVHLWSLSEGGLDNRRVSDKKSKTKVKKVQAILNKANYNVYGTSGFWWLAIELGLVKEDGVSDAWWRAVQVHEITIDEWKTAVTNACKAKTEGSHICVKGRYVVEAVLENTLQLKKGGMRVVDGRVSWSLGFALGMIKVNQLKIKSGNP